MELRHLRYFVAVAEELSFRRAAERLHIAPPPLSVQIRKLEQEIGTELFSRQTRGVKLTQAGQVFLVQARQTLANAKRGIALAREAANGEIGQLSIGYNAPGGFLVFPQVVPAYQRARPNVHLTFHALNNMSQQLEGLRREELDLGVVWLPVPTEEFDVKALIREPLVAVIPAGHELAGRQDISIKDLSRAPMILPARELHPDAYDEIAHCFRRARGHLNVAYELESSLSMINFVAMGIGCALLPNYVRNIRQNGVVFRPLRSPKIVKTLAIIKMQGRAGIAERFFDFAGKTLAAGSA